MTRKRSLAIAAGMRLLGSAASAETLRIGLADDPDVLDPHQSRTFVGRIVYTALCDTLIDIEPELNFVPQLATEWRWSADGTAPTMKMRPGVTFHHGPKFDDPPATTNIKRENNL